MKKLLCLFLLLWLPLFSAAAAAMSMQMQLSATSASAEQMPCHDASTSTSDNTKQPCCDDHHASRNCFVCGVCAFSNAARHLAAVPSLALPAPDTFAPRNLVRIFSSQLYPPALKPPISA